MAEAEELPQTAAATPDGANAPDGKSRKHDAILRIPVTVQVVLGSARVPVAHLMKLGPRRGGARPARRRTGECRRQRPHRRARGSRRGGRGQLAFRRLAHRNRGVRRWRCFRLRTRPTPAAARRCGPMPRPGPCSAPRGSPRSCSPSTSRSPAACQRTEFARTAPGDAGGFRTRLGQSRHRRKTDLGIRGAILLGRRTDRLRRRGGISWPAPCRPKKPPKSSRTFSAIPTRRCGSGCRPRPRGRSPPI